MLTLTAGSRITRGNEFKLLPFRFPETGKIKLVSITPLISSHVAVEIGWKLCYRPELNLSLSSSGCSEMERQFNTFHLLISVKAERCMSVPGPSSISQHDK